ncbi:FAD-dependent monooxygenase [Salinithrix halophila]|uniref:FAD-dependent monooxygenase n=1 Tax=Salinithrix halophila TaxID=1485204 RepID=A0ABV8JAY3_9BACL
MKVLIVGGGIAGLTLADCLLQSGHEVILVEKAPKLRTEGYMIDFFGPGYEVAEKMGLLPELEAIHYPIQSVKFLHVQGEEKLSISYASLRSLFQGRHYNFMRESLERLLYQRVKGRIDFRFGTTIQSLAQDPDQVDVTLSDGSSITCDLMVGADGVHSKVRSLAFGEDRSPLNFLGYYTAAYVLDKPWGDSKEDSFYMLTSPGRQVGVYPIDEKRLATFFLYKAPRLDQSITRETINRELQSHYGDLGWIVPELLTACETAPDLYFDEVSQVQMAEWKRGRVVLVGDACQAVSLVAGQGASMAMAGAYILSRELQREQNISIALQNYERLMQPPITKIQKSARRFASWFVPENRLTLWMRETTMQLAVKPLFKRLVNLNQVKLPR